MSRPNPAKISPVAAAVSTALATPLVASAQATDDSARVAGARIEEIIVTATKREQDIQKIPASIHALPEAMLKEIGALNTEDYVRFMPSVNWINFNSGGSNQVIFRGINTSTTGFIATQSSSVYLDEIPLTATNGSQPDVRMMDIQRTEALAGPQGTLFGAAAQAGTLRIITNKPDTSRFEASADVMWRTGSESDPSHSVTGVINVPLVEDKFAIRIAAQSAEDGGYIDNVLGHTPDTWFGETADAGPDAWGGHGQYRLQWGNHLNTDVVEENWNSADHANLRVSARWNINDNWSVTAAYNYGDTDSQGSSAYNPFVGDLQTIAFVKNTSHSEWDMSSLTVEADLGFAQLVSATSFYENERTYVIDNTLYYKYYTTRNYCEDRGVWADIQYYWLWENSATGRAIYAPLYCPVSVANPSGAIDQMPEVIGIGAGPEWQERFTQEIRLSSEGERFDWLAGLYYEDSNDSWNSEWMSDANVPYQDSMSYAFMQDCANAQPGDPLYSMWNCGPDQLPWGIRSGPDDVAAALPEATMYWTSWDDTDWKTEAVFGEFTWHATAKTDVTVGGRWFETTNDKVYTKILAGHRNAAGRLTGGFIQPRWDGNDIKQTATISEFVPKLSVSYNVDDEKMLYGSYTEGYRTGGVNRANKNADWERTLFGQVWDPDKLANYEFGLRSRWADNSVQLNVTAFHMEWSDMQFEVVDPSSNTCIDPTDPFPACPGGELPWLSIVGNVGDAHSTGVTADFDWVPAEGWSIGGNATWLEAEIDTTPTTGESGIEKGQQLPNFPEFQGALWATKTWPVEFVRGGEMFVRAQYSFTGETLTMLIPAGEDTGNPSFTNDSYGIADLRIGLSSKDDGWQVDLFVSNLSDERAQVWQGNPTGAWAWGRTGEYEHHHNVYTVRPREYGLRFTTRWGE
jgi:outer membrane receptor protein involved in Fe transport